jgi:hypothetical protein
MEYVFGKHRKWDHKVVNKRSSGNMKSDQYRVVPQGVKCRKRQAVSAKGVKAAKAARGKKE